jgi:hypothetical protein
MQRLERITRYVNYTVISNYCDMIHLSTVGTFRTSLEVKNRAVNFNVLGVTKITLYTLGDTVKLSINLQQLRLLLHTLSDDLTGLSLTIDTY